MAMVMTAAVEAVWFLLLKMVPCRHRSLFQRCHHLHRNLHLHRNRHRRRRHFLNIYLHRRRHLHL
jgi:hypothetical protein